MNINITVNCKKSEVLERLKKNRETHAGLVKEARTGYIERARAELMKKLDSLKSGKLVSVYVSLSVPLDYTSHYDTVISMLEEHTEDHIQLKATEFRNFMEDKWDWRGQFIGTNKAYSESTAKLEEDE